MSERATRTLTVNGHVMRVDADDSIGLGRPGGYEAFETQVLAWVVTKGSTVIDAGANVGHYTLACARATGPGGRVLAFEPAPDTVGLLTENVRANGYGNVTIAACALCDAMGQGTLFLSEENQGDHRLFAAAEARTSVPVPTVTLDDYLGDCTGALSLIKLDVQGAEPRALAGMRRTLAAHPEAWIATEFWPAGLAAAGVSARQFLDQLRALGGTLLRIDERHRRLTPLDDAWLFETVTVARANHTNLLIVPRGWRASGEWPIRPLAPPVSR